MANPLLEPLLATLDARERENIHQWLCCPLHNKRKDVVVLYQKLTEPLPAHPPEGAPGEIAENGKFEGAEERLLRSYLLAAIEEYLVYVDQKARRKTTILNLPLLYAYRQRGLDLHLRNRLNRQRSLLRRKPRYDYEHLYEAYWLEELHVEQSLNHDRRLRASYNQGETLLLHAQLAAYFRQVSLSLASKPFTSQPPTLPLLEEYLDLVRQRPDLLAEPGVSLYYHLCCDYLPEQAAHRLPFTELIAVYQQHYLGFATDEQVTLLKLLLNRAIHRINQEASTLNLRKALNLYQLGSEEGLLVHHGRITTFTFSNVMAIALRLKELKFARSFLDRFRAYLPEETATSIIAFNLARLAYARNDMKKALLHLQDADYQDGVHLMNARFLMMRIYYETHEILALIDLLHATRILIGRKHSNYHQKVYRNNIRLIKELTNLTPGKRKDLDRFRVKVENTSPLSEKEWLLAQVDRLAER